MAAASDPVVIVSARTPLGRFMGELSLLTAHKLLAKARGGYRAGHDRIIDHMTMDGLEDAYETGRSMGDFGEATAEAYQFTRDDQDVRK